MSKKHFDSIIHAVFHGKGGKRLYVYKNVRYDLFSIRCEGKVIDHRDELILEDARFLVGQKGRERVLREKQKNVHAGISGFWAEEYEANPIMASYTPHKIYYNPYKTDSFVMMDDMKTKVKEAHFVKLDIKNGMFAFGIS
tara:strand:+ start:64 stop:483 length:420 start_codon:yes stop_codon:yes gene_type:complete